MHEWGVWPLGDRVLINKSVIGVVPWAAVKTNVIIALPGGSRHQGLARAQEWVVCSEPASALPGGGWGSPGWQGRGGSQGSGCRANGLVPGEDTLLTQRGPEANQP